MKSRVRRLIEAWPTPSEDLVQVPAGKVPFFLRPTYGLETEIIQLIDDFDEILREAHVVTRKKDPPQQGLPVGLFELLDHALLIGLYDSDELDVWRTALKVRCDVLVPDRVTPGREAIVEGISNLKNLIEAGKMRLRRLEIIHGAEGGRVVHLPPRLGT